MRMRRAWAIGGFTLLLAFFGTRTSAEPPPLHEVLDVGGAPSRLVFFQPGDCEFRRRAIVREIVEMGALPVVLYAGDMPREDLGRLLGEEVAGVEVLRLPDVGLETTFRELGIRATPFALTLDRDGRIVGVFPVVGGRDR